MRRVVDAVVPWLLVGLVFSLVMVVLGTPGAVAQGERVLDGDVSGPVRDPALRITPGRRVPCHPLRTVREHNKSFPYTLIYEGSSYTIDGQTIVDPDRMVEGMTVESCPHADHWRDHVDGEKCRSTGVSAVSTGVDVEWVLEWESKAKRVTIWTHEDGE